MFGAALRLLAVGEAGRGMGTYVKNLTTRDLVLSAAGTAFAAAITFATLAAFWALISRTEDPIASAAIMAGILTLVGFLIVFIAYGITRRRPRSASLALREPCLPFKIRCPRWMTSGGRSNMPSGNMVRFASHPLRLAGGFVAGLLAKHFRQV
jgi:hypothetical protein